MEADRYGKVERALLAAVLLCLALQLWLALVMDVNWDEFVYLAHIFEYQRGELGSAVRTFHVHLFGWLTRVPGNEIRQVEAGRLVMLACEAATCGLIYALARCFASRLASLVAVLAFVAAGFTMTHGASFRTDPLAANLTMAALVVVARGPPNWLFAAAAGIAAALAALVTVKVVFYLPAFAAIAAWRWRSAENRTATLWWLAGIGVAACVAFVVFYALHLAALAEATTAASGRQLSRAGQSTIGADGLFPRGREIARAAMLSPMTALLLLIGLGSAILELRRRRERWRLVAILGCAAPLLSIIFYRNAFPYFFPFIMPPAMLLSAFAMDAVALPRRHLWLLVVGMIAPALLVTLQWARRDQRAQAAVIEAVHVAFPRPVAAIDRSSMIASFPKRGFFMSTWGMQDYRARPPIFARILAKDTIPILLLNHPALEHAVGKAPGVGEKWQLLPEDEDVLRKNFIPHWGPLWVAGKRLATAAYPRDFHIAVPGSYTLEGGTAVIDGRPFVDGEFVQLGRGRHVIRAQDPGNRTLRWGKRLKKPIASPPSGPIFRGF